MRGAGSTREKERGRQKQGSTNAQSESPDVRMCIAGMLYVQIQKVEQAKRSTDTTIQDACLIGAPSGSERGVRIERTRAEAKTVQILRATREQVESIKLMCTENEAE